MSLHSDCAPDDQTFRKAQVPACAHVRSYCHSLPTVGLCTGSPRTATAKLQFHIEQVWIGMLPPHLLFVNCEGMKDG